jgi:hypothetical protein
VRDGLCELVADAHGLLGARGHVVVETVCESCALLLGVRCLLVVEFSGEGRVVGHVAVGELDFGALLLGQVGGGGVGAEGVLQVLLVCLGELRGDGLEGREDRVGDAERLLRLGCEGFGEVDLVELRGAGNSQCPCRLRCAPLGLPRLVNAYHLDLEYALLHRLLVSYFESSDFR